MRFGLLDNRIIRVRKSSARKRMFMKETKYSLGTLMKAARKSKKLNQAEVAQAIGCSQSALSKMEHDLLVPSAPQWFLFARFTDIPPESIEAGIIDRNLPLQFSNIDLHGFKIPRRYKQSRVAKLRVIYPFVKYLELKNNDLYKKYLATVEIDPEFFVDFDNLINFQLYVDTLSFFIENNLHSPEIIREITELGQDHLFYKHLGIEKADSVKEVFSAFVDKMIYFHADYRLTLEEFDGKLLMTYIPEYHLQKMQLSDEVQSFLNTFRQYSFERLVHLLTGRTVSIQTNPCVNKTLSVSFEIPAA